MRDAKSIQYRQAALAGGGKREIARRRRQILTGSLTIANGLVNVPFIDWPHVETDMSELRREVA
jgi:hypothetical protein